MTLPNPLDMFDIRGRVALITGASGAFGMVAARVLAGAGARLAPAAGKAEELAQIAAECGDVLQINARPGDESACADMVAQTVARFGRLDILVVASGMNKVALIDQMTPEMFAGMMDANVMQTWLLARAATVQMKAQGAHTDRVLAKLCWCRPRGGFWAIPPDIPPIVRRKRRWMA